MVARGRARACVVDWLPLPRRRQPISAPLFTGYLDDLFEAGGREREELNAIAVRVGRHPVMWQSASASNGAKVTRYVRTLLLDGRPIGYAEDHLPMDVARLLPADVVRAHPSLLLAQAAVGLEPTEGLEWLEPASAEGDVARRLEVAEGSPAHRVHRHLDRCRRPTPRCLPAAAPRRLSDAASFHPRR